MSGQHEGDDYSPFSSLKECIAWCLLTGKAPAHQVKKISVLNVTAYGGANDEAEVAEDPEGDVDRDTLASARGSHSGVINIKRLRTLFPVIKPRHLQLREGHEISTVRDFLA